VTGWTQVAWAMLVRDFWMATSYRVGFLLTIGGSVFNILGVYFLSAAFGPAVSGALEPYGGSYFGFAVVGVAFANFMAVGLSGAAARIREGQMMGTLELMLISPNRLGLLIFASSLWAHLIGVLTVAMYLLVGVILGMEAGNANLPMMIVALLLSIVSFNALGLFAASVVILIKQGNPVSLLLGMASVLLSGVLYPVSVLPPWLQAVAQVLPLTHALELTRRSVLLGEGLDRLWIPFGSLVLLTVVLLPIGLWSCRQAVRIAQTDGSLAQY
jgi:ABC-2 type transport system permease protein